MFALQRFKNIKEDALIRQIYAATRNTTVDIF